MRWGSQTSGSGDASVHPREVVKGELHAASARTGDVRAGPQAQQDSAATRP